MKIASSSTLTLRPFRPDEIDVVWEARKRRATPTSPITPGARRAIQRHIERSGRLYDGFLRLAIDVDGALVGEIDARCPANAFPPGVFEIGIEVYAGAGIVDHVHLHVVPRWSGDTNFMPVLADVKVLPEHLAETRRKLAAAWPR